MIHMYVDHKLMRLSMIQVTLQGFPPIATNPLGNTTNSVAIGGYYCSETVIWLQFVCLLQQVDANAPIFRISVAFCWK
jgi:hypothetical protein